MTSKHTGVDVERSVEYNRGPGIEDQEAMSMDLKNVILRRGFLRVLGAGGGLALMQNARGTVESRLVQGKLQSWRTDPKLKNLEVAFRFLERSDLKDLPLGRHVIDDKAYAMIDKSPSQPPEKVEFEAHRKYIDVHYMIAGQVTTGYAPIESLKLHTPYDEKGEAATYHVPAVYTKVKLYPGMFAVFFPGGGHMPNCHLDGSHELHKVVVKLRADRP